MSEVNDRHPELSSNDARLLDALVEAGFDRDALEPLSDRERERMNQLMQMFGLLNDYPVDDADETLIHATQARIDRYEDELAERMSLADGSSGRGGRGPRLGIRVQDFIAVAAAILLVASVSLPLMNTVRQNSIDQQCANNLRQVGYAFSSYAADNNGSLPMAMAGIGAQNTSWDTIANTINLAPLLDGEYCSRGHLNCPGNHNNLSMTYSYQFQRPELRMNWASQVSVVLGDRNPLMDAARAGRTLPATTMSADHSGRGQNVLRTDGAAMWLDARPVVGRNDNIWLPHGFTQLRPGARQEVISDVFLAH